MPVKFNFPPNADARTVLRLGDAPPKARGRIARLQMAEIGAVDSRNREAQMQVTLICYSLWAGFWFQFVIGVCYNMPAIHYLSGGNWYAPDYMFYLKTPGSFPFSVAGNFLFYSILGSALAAFFGWIFTRGVAGKWRLRFAVALFMTITLGWSIASYRAEEAAWTDGLDERIIKLRQMWRWSAERNDDEWRLKSYRLQVEQLEKIRETREWVPRAEVW
jgi:hypothetical protein